MAEEPRYPDVEVRLIGEDGNAFVVIGRVDRALRRHGVSREERDAFRAEATSGDYDNVLATCARWVTIG